MVKIESQKDSRETFRIASLLALRRRNVLELPFVISRSCGAPAERRRSD